jgi:hypothetical protein
VRAIESLLARDERSELDGGAVALPHGDGSSLVPAMNPLNLNHFPVHTGAGTSCPQPGDHWQSLASFTIAASFVDTATRDECVASFRSRSLRLVAPPLKEWAPVA